MAGSEQEDDLDSDSDLEFDHKWKGLSSRELGKRLAEQSCTIDKDQWIQIGSHLNYARRKVHNYYLIS